MILLDTNALIWIHRGHKRTRRLLDRGARLYASPASLLELQVLSERGRLRFRPGARVADVFADDRWLVDPVPVDAWFSQAVELGWSRDPFDRLLVAHALVREWKLATGDSIILEHVPNHCIEL